MMLAVVSNPISGEVGAAAEKSPFESAVGQMFQTPSAGRWVLQREISAKAAAEADAKFQTPSAGRWVLQRGDPC